MAETSTGGDMKKGGGRKNLVVIIPLVCLVLVMGGVICYLLFSQRGKDDESHEIRGTVVTKDNVDEVVQEMMEKPVDLGPAAYYTAEMNYEWHFPSGDTPSTNAYVRNHPTNETAVYFDVVLKEDESKVIYKSPVLPVGSELSDITLTENLGAGTYNCVCIYSLVDDDQNVLSTLRVTLTVVVEN